MRQVRECDFCDNDAIGVYEPHPPGISSDDPRLLLCGDCHRRLATVVEPLLDRIDAGQSEHEGLDETSHVDGDGTVEAGSNGGDNGTDEAGHTDDGGGDTDAVEGRSVGGVDAGGRTPADRDGTPRGYRKVMRFLENRAFPMEREEAERLAAAAYDVDQSTVSAAIDHAVSYDRLRDVNGELRR